MALAGDRCDLLSLALRDLLMPKLGSKQSLCRVKIVQVRVDCPLCAVARDGLTVFGHIKVANIPTLPVTRPEFEAEAGDRIVWICVIWDLLIGLLLPLIAEVVEVVALGDRLIVVADGSLRGVCRSRERAIVALPSGPSVHILDVNLNVTCKSALRNITLVEDSDFVVDPHALV